MKIAIFGGTFDPVHNEHVKIVKTAVKELGLDKLIIVPTFIPPHKDVIPAPAVDRVNMLKIAFNGVEKVEISDFEIKNGGKSYTYATVEHFKEIYPESELYFLLGADMLKDFKNWRYPERIIGVATLVLFLRKNFYFDLKTEEKYYKNVFKKEFIKLPYEGQDVSSTEIRVYLSFGIKEISGLDARVREYAEKNGLYKGDIYTEYVKKSLPEKRLVHTANVVVCALKKVKELKLDYEKVRISATLHDVAKYKDKSEFTGFTLPPDVPKPVEHAFLGAYVAEKVLKIEDVEIIDAIRYHTSGKAEMSTLSKLVFVADMIEKGRDYLGVECLRELYDADFNECFKKCLSEEVIHLLNKKEYVYIETLNAYEYYVRNKKEG